MVEDVWLDVDPHTYHGLPNSHDARSYFAEHIQAYQHVRDQQAEQDAEPLPLVEKSQLEKSFIIKDSVLRLAAQRSQLLLVMV